MQNRKKLSTPAPRVKNDRRRFLRFSGAALATGELLLTGCDDDDVPMIDDTAVDLGSGAFPDVFSNPATFLALAQAFEDTGVRAYKGQAANLLGTGDVLQAALQIHSVEARHASEVRRLRGFKGWITGDTNTTAPAAAAVYAGEDNTTHLGVDASTIVSVDNDALTEAYDEPLTQQEVLAIASLFIEQ